jgi:hypothetical protein
MILKKIAPPVGAALDLVHDQRMVVMEALALQLSQRPDWVLLAPRRPMTDQDLADATGAMILEAPREIAPAVEAAVL